MSEERDAPLRGAGPATPPPDPLDRDAPLRGASPATPSREPRDRVRLGGMALANGVLVHGPEHWACAVRTEAGELKLASGRKPALTRRVQSPFVRGPLRLAEMLALVPSVRRALPEARLPYERADVVAAMVGSAFAIRGLRGSALTPAVRETVAALLAVAPSAVALRGSDVAEYHGAEHISIGTYEHDEPRTRAHERCGSHLLGPLAVTSAAARFLAGRAPAAFRPLARAGAAAGAVGAAVEVFAWMVRNERHPVARALARPGRELQDRFVTAEPSPDQLQVAEAALAECLRLEGGGERGRERADDAPSA